MYIGDHLIISAGLSAIICRQFKLNLVVITSILLLLNLIDLDHLLTYQLDDGTANSLILHYAHIYSQCFTFFICLLAIFDPKHIYFYMALIAGWAMHLVGDSIANWLSYSIPALLKCSVVEFILLYIIYRWVLVGKIRYIYFYFVFTWIVCSAIQAYLYFGLKLIPQESMIVYLVPNILNVFFVFIFYMLFRNTKFEIKGN